MRCGEKKGGEWGSSSPMISPLNITELTRALLAFLKQLQGETMGSTRSTGAVSLQIQEESIVLVLIWKVIFAAV